LWPAGRAYAAAMAVRRAAYESGLLPRWRPPAPCVAVGNVAWGGSGKTPLTAWLLERATQRGVTACVLTRGYRARPPRLPYLVQPHSPWREAGDEPLLLARAAPSHAVVVDPVRRRSGPWAWQRIHPGLFVLDDGLQHLAVARHLDLVLLRPRDLGAQWNRVLPAGSWREGRRVLSRAGAFLVRADEREWDAVALRAQERLEQSGKPVFAFHLAPRELRRLSDGTSAADLGGEEWVLLTGVADPHGVARSAESLLGRAPRAVLARPDHHAFTGADWDAASAAAGPGGHVLCTPKDAVKLENLADERLWVLQPELRFGARLWADAAFPEWWDARFDALAAGSPARETA
jgi:tetraacyldisaccharide 4'-kinase